MFCVLKGAKPFPVARQSYCAYRANAWPRNRKKKKRKHVTDICMKKT